MVIPAKNPKWWEKLLLETSIETSLTTFEPLADKTTFRVGGPARFYAEPASVEDLAFILKVADECGIPFFLLGRGSNLIVPDGGYEGLVIRLSHESWRRVKALQNDRILVASGARLKQVCAEACQLGLTGFEFLEGIPGSLGGSLRMNAGAMGNWIFDVVEDITLVTYQGELLKMSRNKFNASYRSCPELSEAVVVSATLRSSASASTEDIRQQIEYFADRRKSSQPREPSAGCIFRNPQESPAGKLIEEMGLKGRRIGDAEVSLIHGNFIINRGSATSRDILQLIRSIRREAKVTHGIDLKPEVMLLGRCWESVL